MKNETKQSVTEWQFKELEKAEREYKDHPTDGFLKYTRRKNEITEQAKEMEKGRLEKTWIEALDYAISNLKGFNNLSSKEAFDKYYNETYGGNK